MILLAISRYLLCILHFFANVNYSYSQPDKWCPESDPFRLRDCTCDSYSKICTTNPDQCNELQKACRQCPANITMKTINQIMKYFEEQVNHTKIIAENILIMRNSTITKVWDSLYTKPEKRETDVLVIILIIMIIILFILIIEIRSKIITKFYHYWKKSNSFCKFSYKKITSRKKTQMKNLNENIDKKFNSLQDIFVGLNERLQSLESINDNLKFCTIKFKLSEWEFVDLNVQEYQNIVQIKHQICNRSLNFKEYDFKRMKLSYKENVLKDNEYLLNYICRQDPTVNCYIDPKINFEKIIVVRLRGEMQLPNMLQIDINETCQNVIQILENITKLKDLRIFNVNREINRMNEMKIKDTFTNEEYLTVVERKMGFVKIDYILKSTTSTQIEFKNTDSVSTLLTEFHSKFILFHKNVLLDRNSFIFEYKIENNSKLDCYIFKSFQDCDIKKNENIYQNIIFNAEIKQTGEKILLKTHSISYKNDEWKNDDLILNELKAFPTTKGHSRFVQLKDVFLSKTELYISMEFMSNGTLALFLKENKHRNIKNLSKWSTQILEGLKYLHDCKVIYRDLNPSNILLDDELNLKLFSSNLSKFNNYFSPSSILQSHESTSLLKIRYMAPEILKKTPYGMSCDIWSFGAVLIRIVTGKKPYPKLSKEFAQNEIIKNGTIIYDKHIDKDESFQVFISIIDSCVKCDPNERKNIKLLQNEIKKS